MAMIEVDNLAHKGQWFSHLFLILFFQLPFFSSIMLCFFSIITLNYKLIIILGIISILQSFTKKS
jgi:hypothetical protein